MKSDRTHLDHSSKTVSDSDWLSSRSVRQLAHISGCDLMHLRESGAIRFEKQGNSYRYHAADVRDLIDEGHKG